MAGDRLVAGENAGCRRVGVAAGVLFAAGGRLAGMVEAGGGDLDDIFRALEQVALAGLAGGGS